MCSLANAILLTTLAAGSASAQQWPVAKADGDFGRTFSVATPEEVGMRSAGLVALTDQVENAPPILSILISRHGKLVYELYTSGIDREQAHHVMSVTKSVVSALVGIAIDEKLLAGPDTAVTKAVPRHLFPSDEGFARFSRLTLRQVLGMAALDAPLPPQDASPAAARRQQAFWSAPDRVAFALQQPLLPEASGTFQYNDVTPMLAIAMLQGAARMSAFEFAQQHLFGPLGFRNAEWMHQDATGNDNGGYGLRLRPIDMQKLGVLFLMRGSWDGRQVVARKWVEQSFTPWNRSRPEFAAPNYGWFWWTRRDGKWLRHEANGWRGQRIAVVPELGLVVTMTANVTDGTEERVFGRIMDELLPEAVQNANGAALPAARAALEKLRARLADARGWQRLTGAEPRMVPSVAPKESRLPFREPAK
jgi:CubicO group peptidase (beta-lactamase class C family)